MALSGLYLRVVDAQFRYYGTLGRLAAGLARTLFEAGTRAVRVSATSDATGGRPAAATPPAAMVLESHAGGFALGMFLVENRRPDRIAGPVAASAFVDPDGAEVRPRLAFDPTVIALEPGEQTLVKVLAAFDESLAADVRYHGSVGVPGLSSRPVPVVLRRRPGRPRERPPAPALPPADHRPATRPVTRRRGKAR